MFKQLHQALVYNSSALRNKLHFLLSLKNAYVVAYA